MFCPKCSKEVSPDDVFCRNCGNNLKPNPSPKQTVSQFPASPLTPKQNYRSGALRFVRFIGTITGAGILAGYLAIIIIELGRISAQRLSLTESGSAFVYLSIGFSLIGLIASLVGGALGKRVGGGLLMVGSILSFVLIVGISSLSGFENLGVVSFIGPLALLVASAASFGEGNSIDNML